MSDLPPKINPETLDLIESVIQEAAQKSVFDPQKVTPELLRFIQGRADLAFHEMKLIGALPENCFGFRVEAHPTDPHKVCVLPLFRLDAIEISGLFESLGAGDLEKK